jgi:hypothetical protein
MKLSRDEELARRRNQLDRVCFLGAREAFKCLLSQYYGAGCIY